MPDFIVIRLTPSQPADPAAFASFLNGLNLKVFEISSAHPDAGLPGDPTPPIGTATYNAPTDVTPVPIGTPPLSYPSGTTIAQHYTTSTSGGNIVGVAFQSVATAVIAYAGGGPEYVAPDLRIQVEPAGSQPLRALGVYYDVQLYSGAAPDPSAYQNLPADHVSAYVTVPAALKPDLAQVQLPADGTPPNYDDLWTAITTVMAKDPGGVPGQTEVAALAHSVDLCRNIAYEIVYGPQDALPSPSESLGDMYSRPPNDGANTNSNEQSRQDFQGRLAGYFATRNATAERLTGFIYALACAVAAEFRTRNATSAILTFPVNPNPAISPKLATVGQAEIIVVGALGIDVPAEYFYALTAQLPTQITPDQRYGIATGAAQSQNLSALTHALDSGMIALPPSGPQPNINPAQMARIMSALSVPAGSATVRCPVATIQPLWSDWLAYPALPANDWRAYRPGDDLTKFWPAEESAHQGRFLDLVQFAVTQGYVDPVTATLLAAEIKAELRVTPTAGTPTPVTKVADLAQALPGDWRTFFAPPPADQILVNRLPDFTLPGTPEARVATYVRYIQKFFDLAAAVPQFGAADGDAPATLHRPTFDLVQQLMTSTGLAFGVAFTPAQLAAITTEAQTLIPDDAEAQAWLVGIIVTINELSTLAKLPGEPASLQFSIMEALYARGFITADAVLQLPQADFQQSMIGTVAYDHAGAIYANAGVGGGFPPPPNGGFVPINPGALVNCVPQPYLSPLGPVSYLHEILQVSEQATCDAPLAPPAAGRPTLGAVLAARRGPLGSLAVSRANLETTLPIIDLVNECLEAMAAAAPPTAPGVVYDTSGDALAGHAFCVDDDCCATKGCVEPPREHNRDEADKKANGSTCHAPEILLGALPAYSTPATPVAANAAVRPAVYNKLKIDFSACCLPYSQAIDVSRTYLGNFKSCRFGEMRAFRKCITEFALDPSGEPADFQSHLWRYPVRIDIAIEYLGITPEEYAILFNGAFVKPCAPRGHGNAAGGEPIAQVQPWSLYGFASENDGNTPWTAVASHLPELLSRLCLSYCEFIDLWKTGFVAFGNAGDRERHLFPNCEPCCMDKLRLAFPGQEGATTGLYKIAVFVRLWRKLQHVCGARYSFAELQDICEVFALFNGNAINPDFIRQLAAFQMLRDHFRLPLVNPRVTAAANVTGAARSQILALWVPGAADRAWALQCLIDGARSYADCHHGKCARPSEFEKLLVSNLGPLSRLSGFDPAVPAQKWDALPAHTLRFTEVLAKIWASNFGVGELLFLFTADDHLDGDDPFPLQSPNEALDEPLALPDDDHRHSLWRLRRALLDACVSEEDMHAWTWGRIQAALREEFGYSAAEVTALGEHFFPGAAEEGRHPVDGAGRRFVTDLNETDTAPAMWNAAPYGPFRYDGGLQQLWMRLPLDDGKVIGQLTCVRALQTAERAAVQELCFQPWAMLSRFAFLFADFTIAAQRLIQTADERERWDYFRRQFALAHLRCRIVARHLAKHVEAATGQKCPEGAHEAFAVLRSLHADENGSLNPPDWEDDAGQMPKLKWAPAPNGSAFAAMLGLIGTGLLAEFTAQGGTVVWREPSSEIAGFGRARDLNNCPIPTVVPALDLAATPEQMRFVSIRNGLATKDATGESLGGAEGFSVQWSGALMVEKEGDYAFSAGPALHDHPNIENPELRRRRWHITLKRGQRTWVVASHNWPGHPHHGSAEPLHLRCGAYELRIDFVEPAPLFEDGDDLFPLHTGLRLRYAGPDTDHECTDIPHERLILLSKDNSLGQGLAPLSASAAAYLDQLYVSSLRDIRRTYQRAFKAVLFAHRFALSARPRAGGASELGYMLAHGDRFAGTSYYQAGAYRSHHADFNFNLLPLSDDFLSPVADARTAPSLKRIQALFDWWERLFDYDRVRAEVWRRGERHLWLLFDSASEKEPAHPGFLLRHMGADARHWELDLRYFQGQFAPVYAVSATDLEDDRWTVRVWHADRWLAWLERCFTSRDIAKARPDLWASDDPSAVLPGEAETGNANLSQFLCDGLIENGLPCRYDELKRLNDGLRERGRHALLAYLCGPFGIATSPKAISEFLLLDVEVGLREKSSRIDEAISAAQCFVQRGRLGLEPGWTVTLPFAQMWDDRFASYQVWERCKRRELYKENWIDISEIAEARKTEAFGFLDEELRRVTLTIAAPGGGDYWPDSRPAWYPGLKLLQTREPATMQVLPQAREGLGLLGTPERADRTRWLAALTNAAPEPPPPPENQPGAPPVGMAHMAAAAGGPGGLVPQALPFWIEAAIELGTRFVRVAAAGYPQATAHFVPHKPYLKNDKDTRCVTCCCECGKVHPPHMDEYYFWLVDCRRFEALEQDSYYDQNLQSAVPWHDPAQRKTLLEWPSEPALRLAWCRVHNGEFQQPRRSDFFIPVPDGVAADLAFQGRVDDSLYFFITNAATATAPAPGYRYDLATDGVVASLNLVIPSAPSMPAPGGLIAYPFFGYVAPGAPLLPWSLYAPALAIALALRTHCRFEAALRWLRLVYDPLQQDSSWVHCGGDDQQGGLDPATGAAANLPAQLEQAGIGSMCCDSTSVTCAVARNRAVLLYALETLLQWGDGTLRRNTPEAFQQARLIFDAMAKIMGKLPPTLWNSTVPVQTVATFVPLNPPLNPRLMTLYDRLDDRLGLIHHSINARRFHNGKLGRDMPYFGNDASLDGWRPVDEAACAEGGEWCLPHSPYRFPFLLQKAREYTSRLRELGAQLLSVLEKADAEGLAGLRTRHEHELASLGLKLREDQWRDADWQLQSLGKTKENRQNDRRYYAELIASGLINNEQQYLAQVDISQGDQTAAIASNATAEAMDVIPDLFVGFPCEETWQPLGTKLAGLYRTVSQVSTILSEMASTEGSRDLTQAGWDRRLQDWVHRVELLDIEIEQIELQILAAERRRAQALRELNIQQRQIENATEVQDFLRDKFSSHAVYLHFARHTADLYQQAFELALQTARQAQHAFNFERGNTAKHFIPAEPWDNLHEGLLAGERLDLALTRMEKEYCDLNVREEEVTKYISLRQHFPAEFLQLKLTGRCEIGIPEWMFDFDYPGHYMRRIKNVALTIPCVTGPYTGVHCRLTLLSSATRVNPLLSTPAAHCCNECTDDNPYEACHHDPRVLRQYAGREAIATSSGRSDPGLIELNFRDDRYLPFEYHGAVSNWRIELPPENNFFDMESLTDVILHFNYTAREGGELLRQAASKAARKHLPGSCWSFFDLRHDFSDAWARFRAERSGNGSRQELTLRLKRSMFPFLPGRPDVCVNRMALVFETDEALTPNECECPCPVERRRDAHTLDLVTCRVNAYGRRDVDEIDITCVSSADQPCFYRGICDTSVGPLESHGGHHDATFVFRSDVGRVERAYLLCQYTARC